MKMLTEAQHKLVYLALCHSSPHDGARDMYAEALATLDLIPSVSMPSPIDSFIKTKVVMAAPYRMGDEQLAVLSDYGSHDITDAKGLVWRTPEGTAVYGADDVKACVEMFFAEYMARKNTGRRAG